MPVDVKALGAILRILSINYMIQMGLVYCGVRVII